MAVEYRTREGDTVDLICWRYYRDTSMTEAVYQANHGLADQGDVLPSGLLIVLPTKPVISRQSQFVSLWD